MDTTIFVAKIFAIAYLALGVGISLNGEYYKKMFRKMFENTTYIFFGGFLALVLGFTLITYHNVWTNDLSVLVTVVGYISFIKGLTLLIFPKTVQSFEFMTREKYLKNIVTPLILLMGLVFAYLGFGG